MAEVEIIRYGMEETLDAGMYQILTRKQKFINDGLKGKRRNLEELNDNSVDYATFSATISGNPLMKRKVEVETRLRELQSLEYQFRRSLRRNTDLKNELLRAIPHVEQDIVTMKQLAAHAFSTEHPAIELNGVALDGTAEYKVKQLASYLANKGLYPAITQARTKYETAAIDLGYAKINSIEIELTAIYPFENYRVQEDKAAIRYVLHGIHFHNRKIRIGGEVTTGSGLITSLKSVLEHKTKDAADETEALELNRQRLQQLLDAEGKETFKFADERNVLQKELESLLYELNAKNLLQEGQADRRNAASPRLSRPRRRGHRRRGHGHHRRR